MKLLLLRVLLMVDAAVLFLLGAFLVFAPNQIERAFHFQDLPAAVTYMIGLWGCMLVTLGAGYWAAARNPLRNAVWVQVAIARGLAECALGIYYLARGTVTFQQAGFGVVLAGLITLGYVALYPRAPRLVDVAESPKPA